MDNKRKIKEWPKLLLIFLVVHALLMCAMFIFVKKEYHSDEMWSFGLANYSKSGAIFADRDKNPINYGEWISAREFQNYLCVQPDERFHYEIPYKNAISDNHPPLSYFLIHTISSLFPNRFSFWIFIPFQILFMLICDVYIYKILRLFQVPLSIAIASIALFAFSSGGLAMLTFLRMYTMAAMFGVMVIYYTLQVLQNGTLERGDAIKIGMINLLGALSNHEYLFVAFFTFLVAVIYMLIKQRYSLVVRYILAMGSGIIVSILVFPATISHLLGNAGGDGINAVAHYPYWIQMMWCLQTSTHDIFGFGPTVFSSAILPTVLGIVVYVVILMIPLGIFFYRDEKLRPKLVCFIALWKEKGKSVFGMLKQNGKLFGVTFLVYLFTLLLLASNVMIYGQGAAAARYLFVLYPILVIWGCVLIYVLVEGLCHNKKKLSHVICMLLMFACIGLTHVYGEHVFWGQEHASGVRLPSLKDTNIIVIEGDEQYFLFERVVHEIDYSNRVISVEKRDLDQYRQVIDSGLKADKTAYVVLTGIGKVEMDDAMKDETDGWKDVKEMYSDSSQQTETNKIIEWFLDKPTVDNFEKIGEEHMINTSIELYRIN